MITFLQVKDQNLQKQYPWRFRFKVKLYPEDVSFNIIQDVTLVSVIAYCTNYKYRANNGAKISNIYMQSLIINTFL